MASCRNIIGRYVDLCCVTPEDAEFTLAIRQDPEFEKYLPRIDNTLEQQILWINQQQQMQDDYFFVVWSKDNERIGTIGVFDIFSNPPKIGRLAMKGNALQNIEAHMLILQFAYYSLKLDNLWGFVYSENERAIRFDLQYGANFEEDIMYKDGRLIKEVTFSKKNFEKCLPKLIVMLYRCGISENMTYVDNILSYMKERR